MDRTRTMSPRDPRFAQHVLEPRGIFVSNNTAVVAGPFAHFGTSPPPRGDYGALADLGGGDDVWVVFDGPSAGEVAAEFRETQLLGLCDEEFFALTTKHFLRAAPRSRPVAPDGRWRADRMLQLACPTRERLHWRIPDYQATAARPDAWSWAVRSDCSYWLSLRGFDPEYASRVRTCAVVRARATCPYLTVEFTRDDEPEEPAIIQVCAAGALALFNRCVLHAAARATGETPADNATIRHYALTLVGPEFAVWVLRPTWDGGRWAGCVMQVLFEADCGDEFAVRRLADWLNEIHRWGLAQYGPGCEADINAALKAGGAPAEGAAEPSSSSVWDDGGSAS